MNYKFEMTEQEANIVLQSLAKQPFEVVSPIINKIQFQAAQQQQAEKNAELAEKAKQELSKKFKDKPIEEMDRKAEKPEKPLPELKKKA
jgi:anion-transporting  ArsA/GET3 family ATPase